MSIQGFPRVAMAALCLLCTRAIDCSPVVRVKTEIRLPRTVPPDATQLHLALATGTAPMPAPAPSLAAMSDHYVVETAKHGFVTEIHIRGHRHWVQLTAWVDVNGNSSVDSGDFVGTLPAAVEAADRGLCAGNMTETPPIIMNAVP